MRSWMALAFAFSIIWEPAQAACNGAPHDQFNFWLGEWHDTAAIAGEHYVVRRIAVGCAVEELLVGADGETRGVGMSGWDDGRQQWRQLWADADRIVRLYQGGPAVDGAFVLTSEPESSGKRWRYTYLNIQSDSIDAEYAWRGGESGPWTTVWKGHYERIKIVY